MKTKWKEVKIKPTIESPTWGNVQLMAEKVMAALGGNAESARKLDTESFYTLCILASLMLDEHKASRRRWWR